MDNIVIIADDLTGAADSAVQFCPYFDDTMLVSYQQWDRTLLPALPSSTRATAIYTNSRALVADQARNRLVSLTQGLREIEALRIYKKIDSCMRGNVGAESDALLDQLGYAASFITPAFPEMGRTTREDIHRIYGKALDQTEIAQDPVTPVTESSLTRIVALQSRYPVGHVGLAFLENSNHRLMAEIERQLQSGVRHVVFDATNRAHLDRVARSFFAFEGKILPIGSAGLAGSIAKLLNSRPVSDEPTKTIAPDGFNLLVCGTTSAVTGQQIEKLLQSFSYDAVQLNPAMLADPSCKDEFSDKASVARSGLLKKNMILTIKSHKSTRNTPRQPNFHATADSIIKGLGHFVAKVVAETKPGHLFLTGGDTADAVLAAFETKGIRILGEVVAGVVQGVILGGLLDGLPVVTKAGAFGQNNTLVAVHKFWQRMYKG
jgi:uncharacterized protein YgbK (DUF1537 family)